MGVPVSIARRSLHAAQPDPHTTLLNLAQNNKPPLFDALLEQTSVLTGVDGWQTLTDPSLPDPLTLRGLVALAPPQSTRAAALRAQLTALSIDGDPVTPVPESLRYLGGLPALQRLRLRSLSPITGWSALHNHPALTELSLERCWSPAWDDLLRLRLQVLRIHGTHPCAPAIRSLPALASLRKLSLRDLPALATLPALDALPLEVLELVGLPELTAPIALPSTLRTLRAPAAITPRPPASVTRLEWVSPSNDHADAVPDGVVHLGLLQSATLTALPERESLETVDLSGCTALTDLGPLGASRTLRWADLRGCAVLSDLGPLSGLPALDAVATAGTAVRHKTLPAAMRRLVSAGWAVSMEATARRRARARMPSTPLSPLLREAMQRIRALLRSNDTPTIKQALELIFSLDDPELYAALLRGTGTVVEDGQLPQLRLSGPFSAQGRDARRMRWALLRVLRAAPTQPFCQTATALHLDSPVLDTEDLVFPALETLSLWRVRRWQNAGHLETMEHLRDLRLHTCARPADLALPTGLQTLRIDGDHTLPDLSLTARLNALSRLELLQVDALARLDGVPASVSTLHILRAASLSDVSALSGCPRLEDVNLSGCVRLGSLDGMQPGRLRVLRINQAPRLASLRALRGCVALEELELSGCGSLPSLEGVEDAAGLRALVLHDLAALATLDAVQHADLVRLDIQNCPRLASLSGLAGSHSLKALNAAGLAVEGLDGLAGLRGLRRLALRACGRLADVSGLADLAGLEVLSLSGCPTLADLSGLPPLRALTLDAVAATDLSTLPELGVLVWRGPATQALLESVPSHVLRLRLQRAVVDPADVPAALADRIRWVV